MLEVELWYETRKIFLLFFIIFFLTVWTLKTFSSSRTRKHKLPFSLRNVGKYFVWDCLFLLAKVENFSLDFWFSVFTQISMLELSLTWLTIKVRTFAASLERWNVIIPIVRKFNVSCGSSQTPECCKNHSKKKRMKSNKVGCSM